MFLFGVGHVVSNLSFNADQVELLISVEVSSSENFQESWAAVSISKLWSWAHKKIMKLLLTNDSLRVKTELAI